MSVSKVQTFDVLANDDVKQVHETTLKVLETVGMVFEYEPALEVLREAGQRVDGNRVYFDPSFVEEKIALAPAEITVYARDPKYTVTIGNGNIVHVPAYGPPFIVEPGGKRRSSVWDDYMNLLKLAHVSDELHTSGGMLCEPSDLDARTRYLDCVYAHIRYSTKTFMGSSYGAEGVRDTLELMAPVCGGKEVMKEKPTNVILINTISPLKLDDRMTGALVEGAKWNVPLIVTPALMCGSTGPATLAGGLVVQNAEVLGGITLAQTINPGTPVIYGTASAHADMNSGAVAFGSVEFIMLTAASSQMARVYKMPSRGGGGYTEAKHVGLQAGYEASMLMMCTVLSGIDYQLHAAGLMHSAMSASYEKYVLDFEILNWMKHFKEGIKVNDDTLAFDVIKAVGPGGHFLTQRHTKLHHKTEFLRSLLSDRRSYEQWLHDDTTLEQKATQIWKDRVEKYEDPGLDAAAEKEMKNYIEQRKKEILGS